MSRKQVFFIFLLWTMVFGLSASAVVGAIPLKRSLARDVQPEIGSSQTVQKIIFNSRRNQLATVNPDGTSFSIIGQGADAQLSPDGTKIVFVRAVFTGFCGFSSPQHIFVMNSDGTNAVDLTPNSSCVNTLPAWSPNGQQIAFDSSRNGVSGIYVMNADDSNVQMLVPNASKATWSANGKQIAFMIPGPNTAEEIGVANVTGSHAVTLLTTNFGFNGYPAWSPNGSRIAWIANCNCGSPSTVSTMNPDGTGRVDVVTPPTGGDVATPAWSPDSSTIIFTDYLGSSGGSPLTYRLFSVPASGGTSQQLYADDNGVSSPFWGYLAKSLASAPCDTTHCTVAVTVQAPSGITTIGASTYMELWQPSIAPNTNDYSIAQVAVIKTALNSLLFDIEVGWLVDPALYNDPYPHLFVFVRNHLKTGGDRDCRVLLDPSSSTGWSCGFVQAAGATDLPNENVLENGTSPGTVKTFYIANLGGDWWIQYDAHWIGHIASSWFFNQFNSVEYANWQGEVFSTSSKPTTQMGNGNCGTKTNPAPAHFYTMRMETTTQVIDINDSRIKPPASSTATNGNLYNGKLSYTTGTQSTLAYGGPTGCP